MIRHIVAIDINRGIAKNGVIPWKLPTDTQFYQSEINKFGGVLLMGRKTFVGAGESIVGHKCYVMTRNKDFRTDKAIVVQDLDELLKAEKDVWVIGGSAIYAMTLPLAEELYITEIEHDYGCDTFYPMYRGSFEVVSKSELMTDQAQDVTYRFKVYVPRKT